jgi:hypothetical protein
MGYRCPVCHDPQADDVHLANHLAFTALVHGGDHEDWLDDHVTDWGEMGEDALADHVREHAESAEYPAVFEDTADVATDQRRRDDHGHADDHDHDGSASRAGADRDRPEMVDPPFGDGMDEKTREAVERARELTRKRRANATEDRPDDGGEETQ